MTNMAHAEEQVLKTDVLGRQCRPLAAARREQLLDEFEQSGLSGQKFAALAVSSSIKSCFYQAAAF